MRLLLERGANVTLRTTSGHTALYYARLRNHAAVVALLEAHGADEDDDEDGEDDDDDDEDDE